MNLPKSIGVMVLPGVHLFPQALLPLFVFEPRYRRMLNDALESHRLFCVAMQNLDADRELAAPVAGVGLIRAAVENPDGTSNVILQGVERVALGRVMRRRPYLVQSIQRLTSPPGETAQVEGLARKVRELVGRRIEQGLPVSLKYLSTSMPGSGAAVNPAEQILQSLGDITDPGVLADLVSCTLLSDPLERQVLMEAVDVEVRLRQLVAYLVRDLEGPTEG